MSAINPAPLSHHQALEGVGLGSVVVKAGFSRARALCMVFTYAAVVPLGVAIGIGVTDSYDPESPVAYGVQVQLVRLDTPITQIIVRAFSDRIRLEARV